MPDKVYCIIRTGEHVYIPIKAEINPHDLTQDAYLKNLPNFFGGSVYKWERGKKIRRTPERALSDEIKEESQGKIEISEEMIGVQKDNAGLLRADVNRKKYMFYLITVGEEQVQELGGKNVFTLEVESGEANNNEMQCILKVPIANIIGSIEQDQTDIMTQCRANLKNDRFSINNLVNNKDGFNRLVSIVLSECGKVFRNEDYYLGILRENSLGENSLRAQWDGSETKKAFGIMAAVLYRQSSTDRS